MVNTPIVLSISIQVNESLGLQALQHPLNARLGHAIPAYLDQGQVSREQRRLSLC